LKLDVGAVVQRLGFQLISGQKDSPVKPTLFEIGRRCSCPETRFSVDQWTTTLTG
jgi:hypothetical protein